MTAQLLLDKGADINAFVGAYGNALQAASVYGREAIVQLFLEKGVGINAQVGYYGNALQAASASRHHVIVKLLLDKGADFTAEFVTNRHLHFEIYRNDQQNKRENMASSA